MMKRTLLIFDSTVYTSGIAFVESGGTTLIFKRNDQGNFSAATDTTAVFGTLTFEID